MACEAGRTYDPHDGMPMIVAGFVCVGAVLVPTISVLLCAWLNRLAGSGLRIADVARRFVFTLVPIGIAMWAAHLLYHFSTGWSAPWLAVQRIIGGAVGTPGMPFLPAWLTPAQIILLNAGLLLTLYVGWRVAKQYSRWGANGDCTSDALGRACLRTLWNRHLDSVPADADARHVALKRTIRKFGALCAGAVLAATLVFADGGTMLFRKRADPFLVTAFSEPVPVRVGAADLSVMVQNADGPHLRARCKRQCSPEEIVSRKRSSRLSRPRHMGARRTSCCTPLT